MLWCCLLMATIFPDICQRSTKSTQRHCSTQRTSPWWRNTVLCSVKPWGSLLAVLFGCNLVRGGAGLRRNHRRSWLSYWWQISNLPKQMTAAEDCCNLTVVFLIQPVSYLPRGYHVSCRPSYLARLRRRFCLLLFQPLPLRITIEA